MKVALFADTYMPQINGVTNTLNKLIQYYEATGIEYKIFALIISYKNSGSSSLMKYPSETPLPINSIILSSISLLICIKVSEISGYCLNTPNIFSEDISKTNCVIEEIINSNLFSKSKSF